MWCGVVWCGVVFCSVVSCSVLELRIHRSLISSLFDLISADTTMDGSSALPWNDHMSAWLRGRHEILPMVLVFARVSWVVATCSILLSSDFGLTVSAQLI